MEDVYLYFMYDVIISDVSHVSGLMYAEVYKTFTHVLPPTAVYIWCFSFDQQQIYNKFFLSLFVPMSKLLLCR